MTEYLPDLGPIEIAWQMESWVIWVILGAAIVVGIYVLIQLLRKEKTKPEAEKT